jgi:putative ABC transport system permease protein
LSRDARPTLLVLLAAVGAVLLITCANVANLLLARGAKRRTELAVRKALGAGAGRVLRQLLTESAVLASLGVIVALALATLSFEYLARMMPASYPQGAAPGLDWRVLSFTVVIASLTVLLFGAGPALAASRLDVNDALKRSVGALHGGRLRSALVVAEITLTAVLLVAAGLLLRSYAQVLRVEPGFRAEGLLIATTILPPSQYGAPAARSAFYERVLERVAALPGVTATGYVNFPPLVFKGGRSLVTIDGQAPPPREEFARNITSTRVASAGYLATLGVPLVQGRLLDERDTPSATTAVVVNQAMVRLHWPDSNPIGARLKIGGPQTDSPWFTVVGVVGDMRQMGLDVAAEPEMYFPYTQRTDDGQFNWPSHLVVRAPGDPMALASAVRSAVWEVDAEQPVSNIRTMSDVVDAELANRNTQLTLVGSFAVVALLLACVGLYGVLSYAVAQRTSEIGLRMALGAERRNVVRAVLRSALLLAGLGIVIGLPVALGLTHLLASVLFGVEPADPATLLGVCALLLLMTILASYLPARRAASVNPIAALRVN